MLRWDQHRISRNSEHQILNYTCHTIFFTHIQINIQFLKIVICAQDIPNSIKRQKLEVQIFCEILFIYIEESKNLIAISYPCVSNVYIHYTNVVSYCKDHACNILFDSTHQKSGFIPPKNYRKNTEQQRHLSSDFYQKLKHLC